MRKRFWVMAALAASCAPALPSTVPLGRGPLAASTVEAPEPPPVAATRRHDAGAESARDASAADADAGDSGDAAPEATDAGSPEPDATEPDAAAEAASAKSAFAGHYSGEDVTTFNGGPVPAPPQKDPNAKMDVADPGGGTLEFSLIDSQSGKLICKLDGTLSGNTAQLKSGQHCFDQQQGQGSMTATVDSGTATFNGSQLVFDMHLDLDVSAGGRTAHGSIDYHFEGTRQ